MTKRLLSVCMSVLLLLSMAVPAQAEEAETEENIYAISSLEDFLAFAEACRLDSFSRELTVSLETNLDLTGAEFEGIPIFCGTFLGNDHTIRGLILRKEGSYQGLFRYLTDTASVEKLHLEGLIDPGGSAGGIGALAGSNEGRITACSFSGTVSGSEDVGGLVGINDINGVIENCRVEGYVSGRHFVGGIVGKNSGVIRSCENDAQVNTTEKQNSVDLSDITMTSLTSSESSNTSTDIGGIAGKSAGVIRSCVNRGNVGYQSMGYNIGGIAGTQSGSVADCVNYGQVMGRKEVGGIVGQMEPTTLIEYKEDALQILERQLNSLSSVVTDTAGNIQGGAQGIYAQVDALRGSITDAQDAVESLIPSEEEGLPDMDTIQAARNTLSSSMADMTDTLRGMSTVTESMVGTLSNNLHAIENQMNAMKTTLGNASQTLGGSVTDVSDKDTEDDLTGKVEKCINYGNILADLNAGGITGAMAVENDLDHEEDISITGSNSLNFSSELRCVVRSCRNEATVTAGKQNAGGIVGWQSMGLVKDCYNSGELDSDAADYVGGITGRGEGYIRSSGAKCEIAGANYVGGIAGSAVIATDCLSVVKVSGGTEWMGAVLGSLEEGFTDEEDPVAGNRYLSVEKDLGGIDGISYSGMAEPVTLEDFLTMEELPELFRNVYLCFRYENGGESRFSLVPGDPFPEEKIPSLPQKAGYTAAWVGLEEVDLSQIYFDTTFEAEYTRFEAVIQSSMLEGSKPKLLFQGGFTDRTVLEVVQLEEDVPMESGEELLEALQFALTDAETVSTIRYCIGEEADTDHLRLLLRGGDGSWREAEASQDGSYLVAALEQGDTAAALILTPDNGWILYVGLAVLVVLADVLFINKKKSRKRSDAKDPEELTT